MRLGGQSAQPPAELPPNIIRLPRIVASIRRDNGGWRHIRVEAWLAPKDGALAGKMDDVKSAIVKRAAAALPDQPFTALQSAHDGSRVVKAVIHAAAEQAIGKPWSGDVLIKDLLVY